MDRALKDPGHPSGTYPATEGAAQSTNTFQTALGENSQGNTTLSLVDVS